MRRDGRPLKPSAQISRRNTQQPSHETLDPEKSRIYQLIGRSQFLIDPMRLEFPATPTKQSLPAQSNRPYFAIFPVCSISFRIVAGISNRHNSSQLEFTVTPTKHSPEHPANRPFFRFLRQCDD
jgi:hypothetical protein